jgi:prevent-host-death family protein
MIQVNTHEAKNRLSYLLSKVEKDHEKIKICRNGKPIALLVPLEVPGVSLKDHLKQHPKLMGVKIHEDPTAPLDEEDWPAHLR